MNITEYLQQRLFTQKTNAQALNVDELVNSTCLRRSY